MLKWQFSGTIGRQSPAESATNGHAIGHGDGGGQRPRTTAASIAGLAKIWFPRTEACECYDDSGHRSDGFPRQPRGARCWSSAASSVRVLVRPIERARRAGEVLPASDIERVVGDLRDSQSLDRALAGRRTWSITSPRIIASGRVDPREIYESNVTGTRNLLEAARRARRCEVRLHQHRGDGRCAAPGAVARTKTRVTSVGRNDRRLQALQVAGGAGSCCAPRARACRS